MYILSNKKTQPSARALKIALEERGYNGPNINFGCSSLSLDYSPMYNSVGSVGNAVNKYRALQLLTQAGAPTPLVSEYDACRLVLEDKRVVGRKTYHSKGRGFYMCSTMRGIEYAISKGATHFLEYIDNAREFRVHIVNGHSIKVSEKIFPSGVQATRRNRSFGATFQYPQGFNHKKTLRRIAKEAVEALGLDFGAVDLLYKDSKFWVLEVNSAPCLTDRYSDTLERYVQAFMDYVA